MKSSPTLRTLATLAALGLIVFGTGTAQEPTPAKTPVLNPYKYEPSSDIADADGCKRNFQKIAAAILTYRKDHQDIPNWLSDLVPHYLSADDLICPVTKATQRLSPYGTLDPKLRCSYLYEFSPTPITAVIKAAFPGPTMTNRQWKRQQMGLVGSEVPITRCLLHDPVLNLSFGGRIYESPMFWENNFLDVAKIEEFQPH